MKKDTMVRSTTKHIARRTINQAITAKLGSGLIGSLAKVLASQAIIYADKHEIHNSSFGTTSIEKR